MANWDQRWMQLAESVAQWSKDPRRKVGCLIVDADNNQLSGGYNGFPRGIADDERLNDRETKLKIVVHAEANAVAAAARNGHSVKGATAYVTHYVCSRCVCLLIQAGISRVVTSGQQGYSKEWEQDFALGLTLLVEDGVAITEFYPLYPLTTHKALE